MAHSPRWIKPSVKKKKKKTVGKPILKREMEGVTCLSVGLSTAQAKPRSSEGGTAFYESLRKAPLARLTRKTVL